MMESFILLGVKTDFVVFLQMIMIMVVILGPPAMRDFKSNIFCPPYCFFKAFNSPEVLLTIAN